MAVGRIRIRCQMPMRQSRHIHTTTVPPFNTSGFRNYGHPSGPKTEVSCRCTVRLSADIHPDRSSAFNRGASYFVVSVVGGVRRSEQSVRVMRRFPARRRSSQGEVAAASYFTCPKRTINGDVGQDRWTCRTRGLSTLGTIPTCALAQGRADWCTIQFDLGSNEKVLNQRNFMILDLRFLDLGSKVLEVAAIDLEAGVQTTPQVVKGTGEDILRDGIDMGPLLKYSTCIRGINIRDKKIAYSSCVIFARIPVESARGVSQLVVTPTVARAHYDARETGMCRERSGSCARARIVFRGGNTSTSGVWAHARQRLLRRGRGQRSLTLSIYRAPRPDVTRLRHSRTTCCWSCPPLRHISRAIRRRSLDLGGVNRATAPIIVGGGKGVDLPTRPAIGRPLSVSHPFETLRAACRLSRLTSHSAEHITPGWIMLLWNDIAAFVCMTHDASQYDTTPRTVGAAQELDTHTQDVAILHGHLKALVYATPVDDVGTLHNRIVARCETIRNFPGIHQRIRRERERERERKSVCVCSRARARNSLRIFDPPHPIRDANMLNEFHVLANTNPDWFISSK
ncbi:hypothetical protein PR048_014793 [Dryococelus australis]|uniref:Uncharacterized protein n=1 Tax=Dryococelus australis TaxID=614101 RepID=A0ABQ9HFB3_9NEOP|nr:hypothetical protein PR048_014793 [Dryococelus australis]